MARFSCPRTQESDNAPDHAERHIVVMRKLQSLRAWTKSQELAHAAYQITMFPSLRHHFALLDQIRRAALSVPANVAEGYALSTTPQFIRGVRISLGSAAELPSHLEVLRRLGIVPAGTLATVIELTEETISLLVGLLKALCRKSRYASRFPLPASRSPE